MRLRLATRGSALALAQSGWVAERLRGLGHEVELLPLTTSGDRWSAGALPPAEAGDPTKALFVKELEEALLAGRAELAVHSAKDLPGGLPRGLEVAAYPEREDPSDVLIAERPLAELAPGARVGTSSLRRSLQLKALRPDLSLRELRGNVDTRLRKRREGEVDAVVLAAAGLKRLGRPERGERLALVPAPGQGALAVEARSGSEAARALGALDHAPTREAVELERAFLRAVGGGCRTPLGAWARLDGPRVRFDVFWSDPAGERPVRREAVFERGEAAQGVLRLAAELKR